MKNLVIRNNKRDQKKGTMNSSGGGITVRCPHQAAGRQLCFSNTTPFLKPVPFSPQTAIARRQKLDPLRHGIPECATCSVEQPSRRLSLIKYASLSADGKAVMSQIPLWVSCFCIATEAQLLGEVKRAVGFKWLVQAPAL